MTEAAQRTASAFDCITELINNTNETLQQKDFTRFDFPFGVSQLTVTCQQTKKFCIQEKIIPAYFVLG